MAVRTPKLERCVLKIRTLNNAFRTTLQGGRVVLTSGVSALRVEEQTEVLKAVISFDDFTPDCDPMGEADFGSFERLGHKFFWKIDYYDLQLQFGSPDPTDPEVTTRVLTVMLASEY